MKLLTIAALATLASTSLATPIRTPMVNSIGHGQPEKESNANEHLESRESIPSALKSPVVNKHERCKALRDLEPTKPFLLVDCAEASTEA